LLRANHQDLLGISANVNIFLDSLQLNLSQTQGTNSNQKEGLVSKNILKTGLMSDNANGHAWIRDNVYSILSVWALSMAYKKYRSIFISSHGIF
jgi:hypothetical protein